MELTHIDCFAGPGGICTGFKAAGLKTVLAIEKVESCVDTYKANHKEVKVLNTDIREVGDRDIQNAINGSVDIVTAGFPCETFSTAGSKSRSFYDHRQFLFVDALRIATAAKAKLILLENVPAITTKKVAKGSSRLIVEEIVHYLELFGYTNYIKVVLNANEFGIPQNRSRFFILATNNDKLKFQLPTIAENQKMVSVQEAFKGLPLVEANSKEVNNYTNTRSKYAKLMRNEEFWKLPKNKGLTYHIPPKHREKTLERFKLIEPGEGLKNLFFKYPEEEVQSLQKKGILPKKWYIQRNRRLDANGQSHTVTSHCLDELIHPTLNRALTVREVARLQSFPDAYDFAGGPIICPHIYETQDKYEQIGDAVPPLLAYKWGQAVVNMLRKL